MLYRLRSLLSIIFEILRSFVIYILPFILSSVYFPMECSLYPNFFFSLFFHELFICASIDRAIIIFFDGSKIVKCELSVGASAEASTEVKFLPRLFSLHESYKSFKCNRRWLWRKVFLLKNLNLSGNKHLIFNQMSEEAKKKIKFLRHLKIKFCLIFKTKNFFWEGLTPSKS